MMFSLLLGAAGDFAGGGLKSRLATRFGLSPVMRVPFLERRGNGGKRPAGPRFLSHEFH